MGINERMKDSGQREEVGKTQIYESKGPLFILSHCILCAFLENIFHQGSSYSAEMLSILTKLYLGNIDLSIISVIILVYFPIKFRVVGRHTICLFVRMIIYLSFRNSGWYA